MIKSLFLTNYQAPGDVTMVTAAVRDLKLTYPELRVNVDTTANYLWDNNPYLDRSVTRYNAERVLTVEYPLINKSNGYPFHFIHGPRIFLANTLGVVVGQGPSVIDVHLTDKEKEEDLGLPKRYWILNAGFKNDFTNKGWEIARYEEVVARLKDKVTFVQIGELSGGHNHKAISGAIDLRGKTDGRKILQVIYHSAGVLTGVSYPMHLSTMETDKTQCLKYRPCVCILGGREPIQWVQQPNMQALHCCGMLDCCKDGGCWRSRVVKLNDNDEKDNSLCQHPVKTKSGQIIPLCMDMITVDKVVDTILMCENAWRVSNGLPL